VHGPRPRGYDLKINKKERQEALRIALSEKVRASGLWVMDTLAMEAPKTKELAAKLKGLGLGTRVLLVDGKDNTQLKRASRNLQRVSCAYLDSLNAYDVLKAKTVLVSRQAVDQITEVLGR
jgi:large subunit ribosomal protein L4